MTPVTPLPRSSWEHYAQVVREIGERTRSPEGQPFLVALGFTDHHGLTELGRSYFLERFIRKDEGAATQHLREAVLRYEPAQAIVQLLAGVRKPERSTAATVLRSAGFGEGLSDRVLGFLLMLMHKAEVIRYSKGEGSFVVLETPASVETPPDAVFVSPSTPFGNKAWLRKILREAETELLWMDKHFMPAMFEQIWETADGNKVHEIKILSLSLDMNTGKSGLRDYRDLKRELAHRGVKLEWRVIDSKQSRDTHDRWIVTGDLAWNVPNSNAILSGQNSEIKRSEEARKVRQIFLGYWEDAHEVA